MIPYSNSPFERTICDCGPCTEHCHEQPGSMAPGDYERIARFLGKSPEDVAPMFVASPGASVMDRLTGKVRYVNTIVPTVMPGTGRCIFLDTDNRCSIHPVSPYGCAVFDQHLDDDECNKRSTWMVHAIEKSITYRLLRDSLPLARVYNPRGSMTSPRLVQLFKK